MADAASTPDVEKLLAAASKRQTERRKPNSTAAEEERIVWREIFLYVDRGAEGPDPEGMMETCPYPYHLCEGCARTRTRAHEEPVEKLYPQPMQSACEDCGAHSFRPWIAGYDDAFTGEAIIFGLLPAAERGRQCGQAYSGSVMYEAIIYPMIVCDGPGEDSYRVHDEQALTEWANKRFADWEIVAGRRKGFERHGIADSPPSEADLIQMHLGKEVRA